MGGQRLRGRVRRADPLRRCPGRPGRRQARVHRRFRRLHRGICGVRPGAVTDRAGGGPGRAGSRGGRAGAVLAHPAHPCVRRPCGTGARGGAVGGRRQHGPVRRAIGRRSADVHAGLALDLLHQRPDRRGRHRAHGAVRERDTPLGRPRHRSRRTGHVGRRARRPGRGDHRGGPAWRRRPLGAHRLRAGGAGRCRVRPDRGAPTQADAAAGPVPVPDVLGDRDDRAAGQRRVLRTDLRAEPVLPDHAALLRAHHRARVRAHDRGDPCSPTWRPAGSAAGSAPGLRWRQRRC